jgi:hypothetical protein
MDDRRFDQLTRRLTLVTSRRQAQRIAVGGVVGAALGLLRLPDADARRKPMKKRRSAGTTDVYAAANAKCCAYTAEGGCGCSYCGSDPCACGGCSCVHYVRCRQSALTPGPGTGGGYTATQMKNRGFKPVDPAKAKAGAVVVWAPNQKGAYGAGHIALLSSTPKYDAKKKKWTVTVNHGNWPSNQCREGSNTFSSWSDLKGLGFYTR